MDELATKDDGFILERPNGENTDLRRVDDRRELINAKHSEVRDGERRASVFVRLELPVSRAFGELSRLLRDLTHTLAVGIEDHGRDQTLVDRDCHPEMDAIEVPDLVTEPVRVDLGVL